MEITTNALTLWGIFGKRKEIHDMIMELHKQGYLDKNIAKILNDRNILTPRYRVWFAKNVWAARNYIRSRENRATETSWKITKVFCETPDNV